MTRRSGWCMSRLRSAISIRTKTALTIGEPMTRGAGAGTRIAWGLMVFLMTGTTCSLQGQVTEPGRQASASRPNIVFLCTDDQARWAMGAYGNRDIRTPNLDRLARRGAIFRNAFTVTPVCSPSRAALMTSRYGTELGIRDWIDPRSEPDLGLAPAAITWPELLKGFGYATMLAGKWHLGTRGEFHPTRQGFDCLLRLPRWEQPADRPDDRGRRAGPSAPGIAPRLVGGRRNPIRRGQENGPVPALDPLPRAAYAVWAGARPGFRALPRARPGDPRFPRPSSGSGEAAPPRVLCERHLGGPQRRKVARSTRWRWGFRTGPS